MNKKLKIFIGYFLMMFVFSLMNGRNVYAADTLSVMSEPITVSGYHSMNEYYDDFYSGEKEILVLNKEAEDVTNCFLNQTEKLYETGNMEAIREIMIENCYQLHLFSERKYSKQIYALEQFKSVCDVITEYYPDTKYGVVMEFRATLTGGIWYNPNTDQVTRTSSPVFNVEVMNVPMGVTPFCNNVKTGSSVSAGKGYFYVTYALGGYFYDGKIYDINYDFGTHTSSFYATP